MLVTKKERKVTNGILVYVMPEFKGKKLDTIMRGMRHKGAFDAGFHYAVIGNELHTGIPYENYGDIIFNGSDENLVLIVANDKITAKQQLIIKALGDKMNFTVTTGRVEE